MRNLLNVLSYIFMMVGIFLIIANGDVGSKGVLCLLLALLFIYIEKAADIFNK